MRFPKLQAANYNPAMFTGQPLTITYLTYTDGTAPFTDWFENLRDERAQARIATRIARLEDGDAGDYKPPASRRL